jgi:aminoglycoside phosphotransferase (APT) family kinase protein
MTAIDSPVTDRAAAVLSSRWPGSRLRDLGSLTGHSGLTLRGDLEGDGCPPRVVLKLCPPGREPVGRHDVVRQAALLDDIGQLARVRVPEVLVVDPSDPPAVVLGWVDGEAVEPVLELQPGERPAYLLEERSRSAARMLANLHEIAPGQLQRAAEERPSNPGEELVRWKPTMETTEAELRTGANELFAALASTAPDAERACVVHGDYRLGNILCGGGDVAAVIDWEIWSVGDPRTDLGWFRILSSPDDLPGIATSREGLLAPETVLAEYERALGRGTRDMTWFDAMARYKMAAIMGNNLRRHRTGRRFDPYQERLVETIPALIQRGRELIDNAG